MQSIATISGADGVIATVTTYFDPNTGLPVVGSGQGGSTADLSGSTTVTKLLIKDHLGSMVAEVIVVGTPGAPTMAGSIQIHGFGPWGNARNLAARFAEGDRGFTGHEHLADLGLIHMNGRLYDPVLGRFLQADPIIQATHNAQSHNRYVYVLNNPLSFSDPSGFSAWTNFRDQILKPVIGLAVGWYLGPLVGNWLGQFFFSLSTSCTAAAATAANFIGAVSGGFAAGGIAGGNVQSALQGAFSAGMFFAAGSIADVAGASGMSGFGDGGVGRAALHAAVGCATGAAAGGSCGRGAMSAGFAEFAGTRVGATFGKGDFAQIASKAIVGGIASRIGGGRFENGALTGAFGHLFNCGLHPGSCMSDSRNPWQSDSDFHEYERAKYICNVTTAGCTRQAVYEKLVECPTPGACVAGGVTTGQVTGPARQPVLQYVDRGNFAVLNITEPGHMFHDDAKGVGGYVYRNVQQDAAGNVYIQTYGEGVGRYGWFNTFIVDRLQLWENVDRRIASQFRGTR